MASITVPEFFPHPLQEVEPAGRVLTEPDLLERLHSVLPPVQAILSLLDAAVEREQIALKEVQVILSFCFQALYETRVLLDAWHEASLPERLATMRRRAKELNLHEREE